MPARRFLTYNIRLALEEGLKPVVDTIAAIGADVVALQEVGDHWPHGPALELTEEIAKSAGYPHHFFASALFEKDGAYGIGLISRSPLVNLKKVSLPRIVDEQRVLLSAHLPELSTTVWTTHLSVVKQDRDKQIQWLLEEMKSTKPDILMGDLNTSLSDPGLGQIPLESSFEDPAPATYPSHAPSATIDHILYGARYSLHKAATVHASPASDHLPVFTDLSPS